MTDDWHAVHQERRALAEDLEGLTDRQWATPSLCGGWDVHDVVAHLAGSAATTRRGFWISLLRSRFDFDRANAREVAAYRAGTPAGTLERFQATITSTTTPPGPFVTRLLEIVVHGEDIRQPLGLPRPPLPPGVQGALEYLARDALSGGRRRLAGLELVATDTGARVGSGGRVEGPALCLLVAGSGRPAGLQGLSGPGVPLLAARLGVPVG